MENGNDGKGTQGPAVNKDGMIGLGVGNINERRGAWSAQRITAAALLTAVGILIPMVMPIKVMVEPASFTLASHVAIFIAMMLSPAIAAAVAIGTTIGFLISFPPVIALRAASHLVFATVGGFWLQKHPETLSSPVKVHVFSFLIAILHAVCEVAVVCAFYFGGSMTAAYYEFGFLYTVILLMGVGGIIHSLVDFEIALVIYKALSGQRGLAALARR
jgi:niacin transporter